MAIANYVTDVQHIGIPTNDIQTTIDFYSSLGFEITMQTTVEVSNDKVAFLKMKNLVIETYQNGTATGRIGAIDHIALDVTDIEGVYKMIKSNGYEILDDQIQSLPFWKNGVKFFTIKGPNNEKVEFSQIL